MAEQPEFHSFIGNFSQLWQSGFEADLHLRCFQGQAFINLQAGLGYVQHPSYHGQHKHVRPSQLRHRMRREEVRKKAANDATQNKNNTDDASEPHLGQENDNEHSEPQVDTENTPVEETDSSKMIEEMEAVDSGETIVKETETSEMIE